MRRATCAPVMPLATGTCKFFANVDLTRCWAQKPSTIGMMKKIRNALTRRMVTTAARGHARARERVRAFLTRRAALGREAHHQRGDHDRRDPEHDGGDEPVVPHAPASLIGTGSRCSRRRYA